MPVDKQKEEVEMEKVIQSLSEADQKKIKGIRDQIMALRHKHKEFADIAVSQVAFHIARTHYSDQFPPAG